MSPNDYGFLRAIYGHVVPASEASMRWVDEHEGAIEACREACAMMLKFRLEPIYKGQRGGDWQTPDEIVEAYLLTLGDRVPGGYSAMSEVIIWLAQHDPKYWGVEDITTQWYCSFCDSRSSSIGKGVRPISEFTICEWKCDKHAMGGDDAPV